VFRRNYIEVDILLDWLREENRPVRGVYLEMIDHILSSPEGFKPLIDAGVFSAQNPVPLTDPDTDNSSRQINRICRECATEIFFHELYGWWARERALVAKLADVEGEGEGESTGERRSGLPRWVRVRKDCVDGPLCVKQDDMAHAKEFNHVIAVVVDPPATATEPVQDAGVHDAPQPLPQNASIVLEPVVMAGATVILEPPQVQARPEEQPLAPQDTIMHAIDVAAASQLPLTAPIQLPPISSFEFPMPRSTLSVTSHSHSHILVTDPSSGAPFALPHPHQSTGFDTPDVFMDEFSGSAGSPPLSPFTFHQPSFVSPPPPSDGGSSPFPSAQTVA